ncbi:MAG TPA: patatin-like protein, partial [Xanthobacteraceae bacterium]|nr:patatin-like protein [Xanthobacteraceae bacterium]
LREKELRIALVCFGGVSLAVYIHGICKEILKLVRASSALHRITDRAQRAKAEFFDYADAGDPEYDTEADYFCLLRDIGRKLELRVIVDTLAGASAGGINASMLARALSHDLSTSPLRDLWLENADVTVLLAPEARARAASKWILKPFIWAAAATGMLDAVRDREVRRKLSLFLRSRWFKPPFSGPIMAGLMYDAAIAMGEPKTPTASLLPSGQGLDLFVTLTDFYGYRQPLQIHDPPVVHEREHRHVLHFKYRRRPGGEVESDFAMDNAPGLAFAARATSCFPGAFPPAQILEMDALLASRGAPWPRREEFIVRNFERHLRADIDPVTASFIDGAVLNNRPFREAITAIHNRSAYRDVDRRLIFIDAKPAAIAGASRHDVPNFFSTIKGALSDLPSDQPIANELAWVNSLNAQVRGIKSIIENARPHVTELVGDIIDKPLDGLFTHDDIRHWRETVNDRVAREAGFAHEGYVRLKMTSVRGFVARMMATIGGVPLTSPLARAVEEIVNAWAVARGIVYQRAGSDALKHEAAVHARLPLWIEFFLAFDVDYRRRRLHFLIEGQNRLYRLLDEGRFPGLDPAVVDRLKRAFYLRLDVLQQCEEPAFFSSGVHALVEKLFRHPPSAKDTRDLAAYAQRFVAGDEAKSIDLLIETLGKEIDLKASTRDLDELLASLDPAEWHPEARREVLINYLGFPFWDVLTFPVTTGRGTGELREILVDRISPEEVHALKGFAGIKSLKGIGFNNFAGFFSRRYRENDYLLGRLHAAERLIDIVCDAAGAQHDGIDVPALKRRAFERILRAEEGHLVHSADLIAALKRCIAGMAAG